MTSARLVHVIDDDEPVRTAFVFALQAAGFRAIDYADANDFLTRGQAEPGIIISDVRMPGLTGVELTRLLRNDGLTVPIILMTGHADVQIQADAVKAGADLVVAKPVALDALLADLARLTADRA